MIPRYEVKEIAQIWSEETRFQRFLDVELALLRGLEKKGKIPKGTSQKYSDVKIKPERILEIEAITRHDVIAFCTSITEQVPADVARYFHFGVTSSDVLDTALALQIKDSLTIIKDDLEKLVIALKEKAIETKDLLTIGRSHGMFAEPMIFGQKFLSFHQEFSRRLIDYGHLLSSEVTGQLSGAVGNYTILDPELEAEVLKELGLKVEPVSTQVVPRDHLALMVSIGSLLAVALERMATEFRLLHHSDINELEEGFKAGQKGSSTMPHKKNPISSENITGMSRVIRSHVEIALQNCVLWHERDISHSSTERMYLPDHFGLLAYSIRRMTSTVRDLNLHRERIEEKVTRGFAAVSSYLLHEMILLNSVTREELYAFVQEASFNSKNAAEFSNWVDKEGKSRGYKLPKLLQGQELKSHYQKRFEEVLKRVN